MMRGARNAALIAVLALTLGGCFTNPDIHTVVDAISWEIEPAELNTEVELRFGSKSVSLARSICGWIEDCEEYRHMLSGIRQVHLGVYDVQGRFDASSLSLSDGLRHDLEDEGWQVVMVSQDQDNEGIMVLTQVIDDDLTGLYVISIDRDELVVVRLEGDLAKPLDTLLRRDEDFMVSVRGIGAEDF